MNNVIKQVAGVVAAVTVFAVLAGVGYITQAGMSQTFGPADPPRANRPADRGNKAHGNTWEEERDPIPAGESVWKDYPMEDLDYEPRLPDRPGNFEVMTPLAHLVHGLYAIEPDYPELAFPFWDESKRFDTIEDWNSYWQNKDDEYRSEGRYRMNKLRQYNFELSSIRFINIPAGKAEFANFATYGMNQGDYDTFVKMREHHTERCVLVLLTADLESLQSEKIESIKESDPLKLFFVRKSDGWRLTYYED